MRAAINLLFLFLLFVAPFSCLKEDDCAACNQAIGHMHEKIKAQNCDPATMQNAVNSINEKCGPTTGAIYIGFMAETCFYGTLQKPTCQSKGYGLSFSGCRMWFENWTTSPQYNKLDFFLNRKDGLGTYIDPFSVMQNEQVEKSFGNLGEGDLFEIRIEYSGGDVLKEATFSFARAFPKRIRTVRATETGATLNITFIDW